MSEARQERRNEKIAERIRRIVTEHIREMTFTRGVVVAVSCVALAHGGELANVAILVYPASEAHAVLAQLKRDETILNRRLFTALRMKHVPRVLFALDAEEMHRRRIEAILKEEKNAQAAW